MRTEVKFENDLNQVFKLEPGTIGFANISEDEAMTDADVYLELNRNYDKALNDYMASKGYKFTMANIDEQDNRRINVHFEKA